MKNRTTLTFLTGCLTGCLIMYGYMHYFASPPQSENRTKGPFGKGRAAVCRQDYTEGVRHLTEYLKKHPDGRNASRAYFFLGKVSMANSDYKEAITHWERVITQFPYSLEANKSEYKIGLAYFLKGDTAEAIRSLNKITNKKNSPLVPEAQTLLRWIQK